MPGKTVETGQPETGCMFDTAGTLCGKPARARGYCMTHYKRLNRRRAFDADRPSTLQPSGITTNLGHIDRARQYLDQRAAELAECLITAAKVAASKGNAEPAQWGLLHTRTVQPVLTGGGTSLKPGETAGVRVLVGVQLGLPSQQPASQAPGTPLTTVSHIGQNAGSLDRLSDPQPVITVDAIPV